MLPAQELRRLRRPVSVADKPPPIRNPALPGVSVKEPPTSEMLMEKSVILPEFNEPKVPSVVSERVYEPELPTDVAPLE